ncbi:MAG TPA: DUF885 domain-containing protein [Kofleriaceae bacterium]|nr:DUF885 domain-containing protein [Kofleriaceae bacterium]
MTLVPIQPKTQASPLAADAVAGVTDVALRGVTADHWEFMMRWSPTYATTLGDHRYDDKLYAVDAASLERQRDERDALIDRLVAIDPGTLGETDRVTYRLLRDGLEADRGHDVCKFWQWAVANDSGSPLGQLSYLVESHTVTAPDDAKHLIARLGQGAQLIDDTIANLTDGLASGRVASREKVRRAIEQADAELAKPASAWAMMKPAWASAPEPGDDRWPEGERDRLNAELRRVVTAQIVPAVARYRDFLRDRVLPNARVDHEGVGALPDGEACYRASILVHVGLPMTAAELHALGEREIARTDNELAELGANVLGTTSLADTIAKLRTDPALYFTTRDEIMAAAQRALVAAKAAIPRFFASSSLPKTDCVLRETPDYEAPYSTVAYYRQPHYDGSKPGEYFVNTYKPETRARFELEALTWHESIPGHHLQIAIAQELGALPAFRKLDGSTAFVEGWALYTERLADEMGLYSSDLDRLGKLSFDAWRAARLVVDTGIHTMSWTRARAEAFMREHTALTEINISNEVDRYIGWPGQALAYKVGQLEIFKLRDEAQAALGDRFDLKAFHAVVLGAGAVTLPVLGERVHAWITSSVPARGSAWSPPGSP